MKQYTSIPVNKIDCFLETFDVNKHAVNVGNGQYIAWSFKFGNWRIKLSCYTSGDGVRFESLKNGTRLVKIIRYPYVDNIRATINSLHEIERLWYERV